MGLGSSFIIRVRIHGYVSNPRTWQKLITTTGTLFHTSYCPNNTSGNYANFLAYYGSKSIIICVIPCNSRYHYANIDNEKMS